MQLRQIHAHTSRRQPDALRVRHVHARVVSLDERRVLALRLEVGDELLGQDSALPGSRLRVEARSQACVDCRSRAGKERARRQFAQDGSVERAQVRRRLRHCMRCEVV